MRGTRTLHDPYGHERHSLTTYDAARDVWHQTLMDNQGLLLLLEGGYEGDAMVMQGETPNENGPATLNRITWSRIGTSGARGRKHWEISSDGGRSWATSFDGHYLRQSSGVDWDVLIQGRTVVNGTGQPAFAGDIAVRDDRIVRVSRTSLDPARAAQVINAEGKVASPGFVDIHTHLDPLLRLPGGESHVRQGVTTALGGPEGIDSARRADERSVSSVRSVLPETVVVQLAEVPTQVPDGMDQVSSG